MNFENVLPFDEVVELRRAQRFDSRSPARERESGEEIASAFKDLKATYPEIHRFFSKFRRQRARPYAQELVVSWLRAVDILNEATDLLLERFYEAAIVATSTAVEVMLSGLIKHHIRTHHFTRNKGLGEEIVDQLMRNGFRDRVPSLLKEASGIDLKSREEWKNWNEVYRGRNEIVHRALEVDLVTALEALIRAARLIGLINSQIESKPESEPYLSHVWALLSARTKLRLDELESVFVSIAAHLAMTPSDDTDE